MSDILRAELNRRCSLADSSPEYLTLYWVSKRLDIKWVSIKKFSAGESLTLRSENVSSLSNLLGVKIEIEIDPAKAERMPDSARRKPKVDPEPKRRRPKSK